MLVRASLAAAARAAPLPPWNRPAPKPSRSTSAAPAVRTALHRWWRPRLAGRGA